MSSALSLIVFGQVYFLGNTSLVTLTNFNPVPNINYESIVNQPKPVPQVDVALRRDYTYTPGIGAHKVHSLALRWNDARKICQEEGGDLAVINSEAEAKVLVQLLASSEPPIESWSTDMALIGFHDLSHEGVYETVDGKSLSEAGYDSWGPGEPNNGQGLGDDCGSMYRKGSLNDANCRLRFAYICELSDSTQGTPRAVSTTSLPEPRIPEQVTGSDESMEYDEDEIETHVTTEMAATIPERIKFVPLFTPPSLESVEPDDYDWTVPEIRSYEDNEADYEE